MMINKDQSQLQYSLSIQVSLDGLSFFTQHSSGEIKEYEVVRFRESVDPNRLLPELEIVFSNNDILNQAYGKVKVIYSHELFTLVPSKLFDPSKITDYLKFNTKILNTDFVTFDELKDHNLINIYVPYANANNFFFDKFGSFEYDHTTTLFINQLLRIDRKQNSGDHTVFVNLSLTHFDLGILKNNKLILVNRFSIKTKEDFLYYLLFTFEQLEINTDITTLHITGSIEKEDPFYTLAYTYIQHIEITESPSVVIPKENFLLATLL